MQLTINYHVKIVISSNDRCMMNIGELIQIVDYKVFQHYLCENDYIVQLRVRNSIITTNLAISSKYLNTIGLIWHTISKHFYMIKQTLILLF